MRKLLMSIFVGFSLLSQAALASLHEAQPYNFEISKDVYKLSEIYQIMSPQQETYPGSIKKSAFRIRTNYDLSDVNGWQATGITRLISLGTIYPWATDIDIYDTRNVQIGLIDGDLATLESAKFNIYEYDDAGNSTQVGVAYANPEFTRFVILTSSDNPHPIAEFNRNYSKNKWDVAVHYPEKIDDRIVRIFAGFVVDFQDKFLTPIDLETKK